MAFAAVSPAFPPSVSLHRASVDSNIDLDEYFASYVPLSNLPTPPSIVADDDDDDKTMVEDVDPLQADLTGAALHIARLVPSNASVRSPDAALIQAYLSRAGLPLETHALTACILDALSFRFALEWRRACAQAELDENNAKSPPPAAADPVTEFLNRRSSFDPGCASPALSASSVYSSGSSYSSDYSSPDQQPPSLAIPSRVAFAPLPVTTRRQSVSAAAAMDAAATSPTAGPPQEIIVLGALSIATSMQDDRHFSARHWTRTVAGTNGVTGAGAVSVAHFNATTLCILKDLDFALHGLASAEMLDGAVRAMRRAEVERRCSVWQGEWDDEVGEEFEEEVMEVERREVMEADALHGADEDEEAQLPGGSSTAATLGQDVNWESEVLWEHPVVWEADGKRAASAMSIRSRSPTFLSPGATSPAVRGRSPSPCSRSPARSPRSPAALSPAMAASAASAAAAAAAVAASTPAPKSKSKLSAPAQSPAPGKAGGKSPRRSPMAAVTALAEKVSKPKPPPLNFARLANFTGLAVTEHGLWTPEPDSSEKKLERAALR